MIKGTRQESSPMPSCTFRAAPSMASRTSASVSGSGRAAGGPIQVEVGRGVQARVGDGGAPVAAVFLGDLDDVGHAPIAQRQQALIVRVALGLDIEIHVVEA